MELTTIIPNLRDSIPYGYSEIKNPEYDRVIASFIAGHAAHLQPEFIHMLGIPGAGKSTYYESRSWEDMVFVGFDQVMEALPAYQKDLAALGSAQAFANWEITARIIGYEILRQAVKTRKNIFFDHGGVNPAHLSLMRNIKKFGYHTQMYYIFCEPELAYRRTLLREEKTLRHTPRDLVEKRAALIESYVDQYRQTADVIYFYNSTSGRYELTKTEYLQEKKQAA